jgi:hypothetical protein
LVGAWAALLAVAFTLAGRGGLGTLLTAAFVLQVTPSVWTAYRTARPTGISRGTWLLILGELSCWTAFGVHKSDPRLVVLGLTGVAASLLMLARIRRIAKAERSTAPGGPSTPGSPGVHTERNPGGGHRDRRLDPAVPDRGFPGRP